MPQLSALKRYVATLVKRVKHLCNIIAYCILHLSSSVMT